MAVSVTTREIAHESPSRGRTVIGDAAAEARIERDLREIAAATEAALAGALDALLLVGGYARHEGSAVARAGGLGPYNDYDLVAVVDGRARDRTTILRELGERLSSRVGVDVDFWPVSRSELTRVPSTLFWLDVSLGGVEVIAGDPDALARMRVLGPRDVPLDECGRLLANRATGIALSSLERVDRDHRKARHGHKAVLAAGDARLLSANVYPGTVAERLAALERLAPAPAVGNELVAAYRDAVRFRARPDLWQPPQGDLDGWFARIARAVGRWHLDYEAWRVGAPPSLAAFATFSGPLFPHLPDVRAGAAPFAAARAAVAGDAPLFPYFGHPRERLARASAALAYGAHDAECRAIAAKLLGARDDDDALHAALRKLTARGG